MKTYNIGVVGSGFMGKAHTYAYKAIPFFYGELPVRVNLRAMCSLPAEAAKKTAADWGYALGTSDMAEFFDSGLDIVHVCSTNDTHKTVVLEAIKRSLNIYCEKPVAENYSEALEISEALKLKLKSKNLITKVGFH
jgi:predicted dehydrogenase